MHEFTLNIISTKLEYYWKKNWYEIEVHGKFKNTYSSIKMTLGTKFEHN